MRRTAACFVLFAAVANGIAQELPKAGILLGEEKRVRDEIEVADRLAAEGRIEEALRRYQQTLGESGDSFVSLGPEDPRRAVPARWLIHRRIAALPAESRRIYRQSVEDRVKTWLEQGRQQRDPLLLEQIVTEAFCSESAEPALLLLGDLALERGEFELAEHYWLMLADYPTPRTPQPDHRMNLRHPDARGPESLVQARLILSLLFRGEKAEAKKQWEAFRSRHPEATGLLAGRTGKLADLMTALFQEDLAFRQQSSVGGVWSTFGGRPTRGCVIPTETLPYWPDVPTWRRPLPGDPNSRPHRDSDPPLGISPPTRGLSFHPVIVSGCALVADAVRIFIYRLTDGKMVGTYDHRLTAGLPVSLDLRVPTRNELAYTLTVSGDRIYARFGAQTIAPPEAGAAALESESVIACLEWRQLGDDRVRLLPRWQLRARTLDTDPPALFEGAPLVQDGRLYLARTRFEGRQAVTSLECYDADSLDQREPPNRRWRQEVWSVETTADRPRFRHELLTLAGSHLVYCTHSGLIVALDAHTGRRAWAFRYGSSSIRSTDGILPRDLCPCLYADGRIYAAPDDADRIFCLDARSGELLWDSGPTHPIHLLGVSHGRLFVTLGGFPQGLRAYDAVKGTVLWTKPDEGDRATHGRGLVSDQFVFWPTRMGLRVLHQEDGEPADARSSADPWGNLAFSEGFLVVTTPTEIWGFVPPRAQLGHFQRLVEEQPRDAQRLYDLALAQADGGDRTSALQTLAQAAEFAKDDDHRLGRPLKQWISLRRRELLAWEVVEASTFDQRPPTPKAPMRNETDLDISDRVALVALRFAAGDRSFPELLEAPELRRTWLSREKGGPVRADEFLVGLLDPKGWAEMNRRAEQIWQQDRASAAERFAFSPFVKQKLLDEARQRETRQPQEAAQAYRQVLEKSGTHVARAEMMAERVTALEGLVRVYESLEATDAAEAIRIRLQHETGRAPSARSRTMPTPLTPDWPIPWTTEEGPELRSESLLLPIPDARRPAVDSQGIDPQGRVFFCAAEVLVCRQMPRGEELWRRQLTHDAQFVGWYGDSAIVAGRGGVTRLRRSDGHLVWEFRLPEGEPLLRSPTRRHFRRLEPWPPRADLSGFCRAGDRLISRQGQDAVLALDIEAGLVDWQFRLAGASWYGPEEGAGIGPYLLATPRHVLIQTTGGEALGLDATNGRLQFRCSATSPWRGPPILGDDSWAVIADGPTVRAINLSDGTPRWSYTPQGLPSLTGAAPEIRRVGRHLLGIWPRNHGDELIRLDFESGREMPPTTFLGSEPFSLAVSTVPSAIEVCVGTTSVVAVDRESGRRLWAVPLPSPGAPGWWRAEVFRSAVLLRSASTIPRAEVNDLAQRARRLLGGVPSWGGVQEAWNQLTWGLQRRMLTLHALDPVTGRIQYAHAFPADSPQAMLLADRHATVVVSGGRWYVVRPRE